MSYSINATKANKAELEIAIGAELGKMVETQPVHEDDVGRALAAAKAFIGLMPDDPARDIYCSVSGSIWKIDAGIQNGIQNVSVSVSVSLVNRK
jgi:hypothetical protein